MFTLTNTIMDSCYINRNMLMEICSITLMELCLTKGIALCQYNYFMLKEVDYVTLMEWHEWICYIKRIV